MNLFYRQSKKFFMVMGRRYLFRMVLAETMAVAPILTVMVLAATVLVVMFLTVVFLTVMKVLCIDVMMSMNVYWHSIQGRLAVLTHLRLLFDQAD